MVRTTGAAAKTLAVRLTAAKKELATAQGKLKEVEHDVAGAHQKDLNKSNVRTRQALKRQQQRCCKAKQRVQDATTDLEKIESSPKKTKPKPKPKPNNAHDSSDSSACFVKQAAKATKKKIPSSDDEIDDSSGESDTDSDFHAKGVRRNKKQRSPRQSPQYTAKQRVQDATTDLEKIESSPKKTKPKPKPKPKPNNAHDSSDSSASFVKQAAKATKKKIPSSDDEIDDSSGESDTDSDFHAKGVRRNKKQRSPRQSPQYTDSSDSSAASKHQDDSSPYYQGESDTDSDFHTKGVRRNKKQRSDSDSDRDRRRRQRKHEKASDSRKQRSDSDRRRKHDDVKHYGPVLPACRARLSPDPAPADSDIDEIMNAVKSSRRQASARSQSQAPLVELISIDQAYDLPRNTKVSARGWIIPSLAGTASNLHRCNLIAPKDPVTGIRPVCNRALILTLWSHSFTDGLPDDGRDGDGNQVREPNVYKFDCASAMVKYYQSELQLQPLDEIPSVVHVPHRRKYGTQ